MKMIKKEHWPLAIVLCIVCVALVSVLTASPLWYDEAVEYYYSKVMFGLVPGEDTVNMYQRVIATFQPPLYNVVMYVWLLIYDSEWWFRLLGVVITLAGSVGVYKSVRLLTDSVIWAACGTLFYALTPGIASYALECAEYYLMLACVSWSLYYFLLCLERRKTSDYVLFFLFAVLAVYSQYGAALLEAVLFVTLFGFAIVRHDGRMTKCLSVGAVVTAIVAAAPLLYFFMLPQLEHQGTIGVSHSLYFAHSTVVKDVVMSMIACVGSFYSIGKMKALIVLGAIGTSMVAVLLSKRKMAMGLMSALCVVWIVYYSLVAMSLYGYNDWDGRLGTNNISGRYCLFMLSLFELLLIAGLHRLSVMLTGAWRRWCIVGVAGAGVVSCAIFVYKLQKTTAKDDVRDVVAYWYGKTDKSVMTYIHDWQYLNFQFYMTHDDRYKAGLEECVSKIYRPTKEAVEIEKRLEEADVYSHNTFYLVMSDALNNYSAFIDVLIQHGYSCSVIYESENGNRMLLVSRKNVAFVTQ